ncbi:type II secretion system protein [Campylobacter insulaenigrae]|uniref:type II secretion system protein n=1 Tax=Campylobacter insulaenigrae TaxID=260714 RepID=UPI0021539A59|nr:type II secretion system protein [Campylobacter insulaenigrae]MCR6587860.1 type II secretion system GspH family protein [Campylobacter insulaenigrae]
MQFKRAFTMIELVFCMTIIAILSMVAYPYFSFTKTDAKIVKLKSEVEFINASLAMLKNQFVFSPSKFPKILDESLINKENQKLFYCSYNQIQNCNNGNCCSYSIFEKAIISNKFSWMKIGNNQYRYFINAKKYIDFSYDNQKVFLECVSSNCKDYGI